MSVHQTTTVMRMQSALTALEVITAAVTLVTMGMDSTAQVIHLGWPKLTLCFGKL